MSSVVKARLTALGLETDHGERVEIDLALEARTGVYCDDGCGRLGDKEFADLVRASKEKVRARRARQAAGLDADAEERAVVEAAYR